MFVNLDVWDFDNCDNVFYYNFVCFLLRNFPASEFYMPTFRNTLKMEQTECSETSAYKVQTPGNYPEESIQHTEHGESLKSRIYYKCFDLLWVVSTNRDETMWPASWFPQLSSYWATHSRPSRHYVMFTAVWFPLINFKFRNRSWNFHNWIGEYYCLPTCDLV